ncbi:MAG: FAD-dependent oxidoreductase, partial [Gammaproteobacteria bacterium]
MSTSLDFDVLIIGSGAAGLTAALNLPDTCRVAVVSKSALTSGATLWAQGGIAAVLDDADSLEAHVQDTLRAGAGLCHEDAVRYTVEHGREAIEWLIDQGVDFTRDDSGEQALGYHLTREGGHSHRRIIHSADATGRAVSNTLVDRVQEAPHITLLENRTCVDLITHAKLFLPGNRVVGAYLLNRTNQTVETVRARFVVLATGGASSVYLYASNPEVSTGDGIAMAWRAGCRVANMEFNQFHPTCLYHPDARAVLISEAVRGEGGVLTLPNG